MFLLSLLVPLAHAACTPSTATGLGVRVDEAMVAMQQLDQAAFVTAETTLVAELACLGETVPRSLAAGIHRVVGIKLYLDHDNDGAGRAFAASRTIEPAWRFPSSIAPSGHPLLTAWEARSVTALASLPLPTPESGDVLIDGRSARSRAADLPVIFQRTAEDGSIAQTLYLGPSDPVPAYAVAPPAIAATTQAKRTRTSVPVAVVAGAAAAAAIGTYAIAGVYAGDYRDNPHTDPELESLRGKANTLSLTSAGIGGVALGLGVTAVIVGRW